jgi:hypothetical protein
MEEEKISNVVGCMYHLEESEFDYLEKTLKEYQVGWYIIGHEKTPYSHFHIAFEELSDREYTNFNKKIVTQYKLRADSKNGKRKQYGKISQVKDIDKLKSYTLKDGNYRSNLSSSQLAEVIERSFKKSKKKEWMETCLEHIEEYPKLFKSRIQEWSDKIKYFNIDDQLANQLILFHLEKEVQFTRNQIKALVYRAIQVTKHLGKIEKAKILWELK